MFGWLPSIPCFVLYFNPNRLGHHLTDRRCSCGHLHSAAQFHGGVRRPRDPGSGCAHADIPKSHVYILCAKKKQEETRSQNGDGWNICKHVTTESNWIVAHIISHRRILFAKDLLPLHQDAMYAYMCNDPIPTYKKDVVFFCAQMFH